MLHDNSTPYGGVRTGSQRSIEHFIQLLNHLPIHCVCVTSPCDRAIYNRSLFLGYGANGDYLLWFPIPPFSRLVLRSIHPPLHLSLKLIFPDRSDRVLHSYAKVQTRWAKWSIAPNSCYERKKEVAISNKGFFDYRFRRQHGVFSSALEPHLSH